MLRARLSFAREGNSAPENCCGTAAALHPLTVDSNTTLYGVELDANRAISARESGIQTIHGNVFDVRARVKRSTRRPDLSQNQAPGNGGQKDQARMRDQVIRAWSSIARVPS